MAERRCHPEMPVVDHLGALFVEVVSLSQDDIVEQDKDESAKDVEGEMRRTIEAAAELAVRALSTAVLTADLARRVPRGQDDPGGSTEARQARLRVRTSCPCRSSSRSPSRLQAWPFAACRCTPSDQTGERSATGGGGKSLPGERGLGGGSLLAGT